MNRREQQTEIHEAIVAGQIALNSLAKAREHLSSAKNWGLFDMLGGGFFASMVKHSKLNNAQEEMEMARENLRIFQRELRDIRVPIDFRIDIGSFLTFADYFFDGLVADWMVQSKINDAYGQVEEAIEQVSMILEDLDQMHHTLMLDDKGEY
ncbi:MAG: hypothetical protein UDG86_01120 [Lachnospiraceae bacterium]|nr:hypothetical protein [Lachnospiraceae bacterium]